MCNYQTTRSKWFERLYHFSFEIFCNNFFDRMTQILSVCDFVWVYVLWEGRIKVLSNYARMKQVPSIKPILRQITPSVYMSKSCALYVFMSYNLICTSDNSFYEYQIATFYILNIHINACQIEDWTFTKRKLNKRNENVTFWARKDQNNLHGNIVWRKMQTKRVKFSIQRTSTTHNNSIKSRLFRELTSQLLNVIPIEDQGIALHILVIHISIILSNMVVYSCRNYSITLELFISMKVVLLL